MAAGSAGGFRWREDDELSEDAVALTRRAAVIEAAVEWHNTKGYSNDAYLALAKLHNAVAALAESEG